MKTILLILVLAFVATIIFDWGMGGFKSRRPQGVIAQVNGEDITYDEFNNAYQQELKAQREQTGNDPEAYQLEQIENQVFERLVQQRLLSDVIRDLNLVPTDAEITSELWNNPPQLIRDTPAFQDSNGVFNMAAYQAALNNPELDPQWDGVIYYMRNTLPYQKLSNLLNSTPVITDDDARLEFMKNNMKAKVDYLFYNAANFSDAAEPTEEEIRTYYNEHKEDFFQIEKRVIDYLLIELKPTAQDSQAVYKQANDLMQDARDGKDFSQLAEIYSQDPGSAEKGGDLGYFKRTAMVKPFADAAFGAAVGDIVGPVESQYGLHIIKVDDKRRQNGEEEVKARHILLKIETSNATRETLRDDAVYIAEYAKESDLRTVAQAESIQVNTSQPFEIEGFIPGIGMERRINRFAFRSKIGDVSDVFYTDRGYIVVELKEIIKEHTQPLEEVKTRISSTLSSEKRMEAARSAADAAYAKMAASSTLEQVAAEDSLEIQQTDEFTLGGAIAGVGREPAFAATAFKLDVGDYSEPIKGTRGYYILQVIEKSEFDEAEFEKQKESLKTQLAVRQRNQVFSLWYAKLKEEADIEDFRNEYF
ncbi:peptidylprolyl isomerase [candidate division KSB1 bacterium]|nr:peptidylprolyl isomerase [candidate division KSB1 bacterium]